MRLHGPQKPPHKHDSICNWSSEFTSKNKYFKLCCVIHQLYPRTDCRTSSCGWGRVKTNENSVCTWLIAGFTKNFNCLLTSTAFQTLQHTATCYCCLQNVIADSEEITPPSFTIDVRCHIKWPLEHIVINLFAQVAGVLKNSYTYNGTCNHRRRVTSEHFSAQQR